MSLISTAATVFCALYGSFVPQLIGWWQEAGKATSEGGVVAAAEVAFVKALVGPHRCTSSEAQAALERAARLGVDPMQTIAKQFSLPGDWLYSRAATLLNLPFTDKISAGIQPLSRDANLDVLAEAKSVRGVINERDCLFITPGFAQLLYLRAIRDENPAIVSHLCLVPPNALRSALAEVNSHLLLDSAVQRLSRCFPFASAHLELGFGLRLGFVITLLAAVALALAMPVALMPFLMPIFIVILASPSLFRLWAAFTIARNAPLDTNALLDQAALPVYSVLIPLRNEAHMVPQIVDAMRQLDYPPEKLDIKFVVESTSPRTLAAVRDYLHDPRFSLVTVPNRAPFTKPKATNYALPFVRGQHVVVFDAEDVPDRLQLRKAASLFAQHPDLDCLQAELLIINTDRNWLTRMFAAEYAGHFGVLLPAISRARLPMPLGGTSNHFQTRTLLKIGGWDAFNVTEDADLGIRLARLGHRTASFSAWTCEEAPDTFKVWLKQRTRWMKGWMQTLIVHNKHPITLLRQMGPRNFLAFEIFVGGMVLSIALHGLFLLKTMALIGLDLLQTGGLQIWSATNLAILLVTYSGAAAVSMIGLQRVGRRDLAPILLYIPFYWLLACVALGRAAVELVNRPFYWAKTEHKGYGVEPRPAPATVPRRRHVARPQRHRA